MGGRCCKNDEQEIAETDTCGDTYTCDQNNYGDMFKTRPPCFAWASLQLSLQPRWGMPIQIKT